MVTDRKPTGRASTIPAGLAAGGLISLSVTIAGAAILAHLISREQVGQEHTGYGVMIILLLASWAGAVTAKNKIKRQRIMICLASGGIYFLTLLMITALFFGAHYSGVGETALLVVCGALLASFQGINGKNRRNRRKKKFVGG